jgi:hypothetical protein
VRHVRGELWAQLKRDATSRPNVEMELILRHYCRFRALCVLFPASATATRTTLPGKALTTALGALAFQNARFCDSVVRALDGNKDGRIECSEYMHAVLALGSPGDKLAFMAACVQAESAQAVSAAELHAIFCNSLDFADSSSELEIAVVADRIVAKLFEESGLAPGDRMRLSDLRVLAECASAPSRADELDVWGMFGPSLVDFTALQHKRLEEMALKAIARDLPISC